MQHLVPRPKRKNGWKRAIVETNLYSPSAQIKTQQFKKLRYLKFFLRLQKSYNGSSCYMQHKHQGGIMMFSHGTVTAQSCVRHIIVTVWQGFYHVLWDIEHFFDNLIINNKIFCTHYACVKKNYRDNILRLTFGNSLNYIMITFLYIHLFFWLLMGLDLEFVFGHCLFGFWKGKQVR